MRRLSAGAMLYVLLIVAVLLWGPLSRAAVAQPGITIGFSVDGSGLVTSSEQGEELGLYLEKKLSIPVKVRSFAAEDPLYNWLTRFNEVDFAWLSQEFLDEVSAGQLYLLAKNLDHSSGPLRGEIVARQGMNDVLRQQMQAAFLSMHENSSGHALLAKLGTSRFVSSALWQTPAWEGASAPQLATGRNASSEEDRWQTSVWGAAPTVHADSGSSVAAEESPVLALMDATEPPGTGAPRHDLAADAIPKSQDDPAVVPAYAATELQVVDEEAVTPVEPAEVAAELPPDAVEDEVSKASLSASSPETKQEEPISLVADYLAYNSEEDSYEAKGDVVLHQADVELRSEELLWQVATQDAAAQGAVQLNEAGTEVSGERLQYNMATGQGQVSDGRVFVREGNFHLAGEKIEKHGQADYFVKTGSFTTCDGEIPDWKFSASEVDVTLGGYARAKNVLFHIKDVPVLYFPYVSFPVKTERESGFLMPSFGYSNNKGTMASLAWYQVIDRHLDATFYLDYLSEIGLGKGLEYRYALANRNDGRAVYYHVSGLNDTPDLYYLEWEHRGELPGRWQLTADVQFANKKLFFEEFGEVAEDYSRDKTVSTVMLRRNWQKLNLVGHARYIKDLEKDSSDPVQRLPELGLGLARYRLGETPFYVELESYATRFQRDEGADGERLYLRPSLSAVFKPGSWLEVVPEVALYERLYSTDLGEDDKFIPEFSLGLATRLVKSFDADLWGADRIQHSIEPKVAYTYVPDESQDELPLFDLFDRIERRNDLSYALVNRLTARSTAADGSTVYREFFNLRLSQAYDLDEARNNRSGENQPFSDLRVEMDFKPTRNFSLDLDSRIPVYGDNSFRTLRVGSTVRNDLGNTVKVDYVYKDEDFSNVASDYIKFQLETPEFKPVYVWFEERYDFRENRELEKVVGLEYRSKCWSVLLTYRDRYREFDDNDQEIMFTFVLAGLGQDKGKSFENARESRFE